MAHPTLHPPFLPPWVRGGPADPRGEVLPSGQSKHAPLPLEPLYVPAPQQRLGFRVWGVGCGVWGLGCGVWGLGCGVWCSGFRV